MLHDAALAASAAEARRRRVRWLRATVPAARLYWRVTGNAPSLAQRRAWAQRLGYNA